MIDVTSAMNQPTERPAGFQGYVHQSQAREDNELTHVDHGTPSGEYLRRFWQPVASRLCRSVHNCYDRTEHCLEGQILDTSFSRSR